MLLKNMRCDDVIDLLRQSTPPETVLKMIDLHLYRKHRYKVINHYADPHATTIKHRAVLSYFFVSGWTYCRTAKQTGYSIERVRYICYIFVFDVIRGKPFQQFIKKEQQ